MADVWLVLKKNVVVALVLEGYPHGSAATGHFFGQNEQNGSHSNIPKSDAKEKHEKYQRHRAWEKEWVKKPRARIRFPEKVITIIRVNEAPVTESLRFKGEFENLTKKRK